MCVCVAARSVVVARERCLELDTCILAENFVVVEEVGLTVV